MSMPEQNETAAVMTTDLVKDLLKEKRWDRRFKFIRSIIWVMLFAYIASQVFAIIHGKNNGVDSYLPAKTSAKKTIALIRVSGMIAPDREFSAETLVPTLTDAFSDPETSGIILDINSPGGTPVQAAIIHDAIITLKHKYHKRIIVVGEDLLTSGAYYVAVAADKIYVNPNTLAGSIGVIMKGFGFVDLMKKMGVERRVYIAGNNKDRLDPFLPQSADDIQKIQQVMAEVHNNFTAAVLAGRQGRLKGDIKQLVSGDFWSGQTAAKLGLVDGLGNLMDVLQLEFKTNEYTEYGKSPNFLRLLSGQLSSSVDKLFYTYSPL